MFYSAVVDIGLLLLAGNSVLFLWDWKRGTKAWKIFTVYLLVIFIIQAITSWLSGLERNNLFLSHYYFILQFLLLSFFYLTILDEEWQKKIVRTGLIVCPIILGFHFVSDPSLYFTFNLFEVFITSFLPIIYAMFQFYNLLSESKRYYYISIGIFTYLFGSTVLFLCGNLIIRLHPEINNITWTLNALLYLWYQIFIFIEWKKKHAKQKQHGGNND